MGGFLLQGLALFMAEKVDGIFGLILLPALGTLHLVMPPLQWAFQGVAEKAHWPVIVMLLFVLMITSVLYAGLFVGLGKLGTWLGCRY